MGKQFRSCDLNQAYLLPPSLQDWLPEGHLARFVAEVVETLDLVAIYAKYEAGDGRGLSAYDPRMMVRVLIYGYCRGVASSGRIERATYEDVAFRYLAADQHPDHDTIAAFRQEQLTPLARVDAEEDGKYGKGKRGDELPKELARRESRLEKIREAKAALEQEAREAAEKKQGGL